MKITTPSLFEALFQESSSQRLWTGFAMVFSVCLMTAAAKVDVPFYPVPLTLQSMVCVMVGLALGPIRGAVAMSSYLALGAVSLPVFAGTPEKGIGITYMIGTTGGYLLGFVLCAFVAGWLARNSFGASILTAWIASTAGLFVLYSTGLLWLGAVLGWDKPILEWGLWPFLPGEGLKVAIITLTWPILWRLVRRES